MESIRQQVELTDLRFYAYHGYYPEEQVLGNEFIVTIRVVFERHGGAEDELNDTVNYESLYEITKTAMRHTHKLLETVAESILAQIRTDFPVVSEIEVGICKNHPPFGGDQAKAAVALAWKR